MPNSPGFPSGLATGISYHTLNPLFLEVKARLPLVSVGKGKTSGSNRSGNEEVRAGARQGTQGWTSAPSSSWEFWSFGKADQVASHLRINFGPGLVSYLAAVSKSKP